MDGENLREDILSPVGPPLWWIIVAGVAALLAVLWIVHRRRRFTKRYGDTTFQPRISDRERWASRLDALLAQHLAGTRDMRYLHLGLAHEMRGIASEYSGRDVTSMTVSDLREFLPLRRLSGLLSEWEAPSFAPFAEADAHRAVGHAKEVISQW